MHELIKDLLCCWTIDSTDRETEYLEIVLPKLQANPDNPDFNSNERKAIKAIKAEANQLEWQNLGTIIKNHLEIQRREEEKREATHELLALLRRYEFSTARKFFYRNLDSLDEKEYLNLKQQYEDEYLTQKFEEIAHCYECDDLTTAVRIYNSIRQHCPLLKNKRMATFHEAHRLQEKRNSLKKLLEDYCFQEADAFYQHDPSLFESLFDYERLKCKYIKRYLEDALPRNESGIPESVDEEKAMAIAKTSRNLLLKARAGSGKTRTLAYKTFFLTKKENIKSDEIMILAFNKDAANEILNRVRSLGVESFESAKTFHSLAYQLVKPGRELLFNDKEEFSRQKLSEFVQDILKRLLGPDELGQRFKAKLHEFFRKEMAEVDKYGVFLTPEEKRIFRRNLKHVTLSNLKVKSNGEKFIADFLFEHDISFKYEQYIYKVPAEYLLGNCLRPDFSILSGNPQLLIEHWGIDENQNDPAFDKNKGIWEEHGTSWKKYHNEMQRKREYYLENGYQLIETSVSDLIYGRDKFECILKTRLEAAGITCKKLTNEEIARRIANDKERILRITEMFVQFIQKAKKKEMGPDNIAQVLKERSFDERTRVFIELGNQVYTEYQNALKAQGQIDFDDLLSLAIGQIEVSKGDCLIPIFSREVPLNSLKFLMIDEYQDFSQLFYRLVATIIKFNPNLKLLCVGDDWQAINGFAGSDLYYFEQFEKIFEPADTCDLRRNYRSRKAIIALGNQLMATEANAVLVLPENTGGEYQIKRVNNKVKIENREAPEHQESRIRDQKFRDHFKDDMGHNQIRPKYLKACTEILKQHIGQKILILNRTKQFSYGVNLQSFKQKLKRCVQEEIGLIDDFDRMVKIKTAHGSKGLEADVVIILNATQGKYPLIHSDCNLYEIFGLTIDKVLAEEKRLFYVAISRAKEKLFILTEEDNESDYVRYFEKKFPPIQIT